MGIKNNIEKFTEELKPFRARLIAVSKTHPVAKIQEAYDAGHRLFGENKVQEAALKQAQLPADIEWHLIGHLQRNKVKQAAAFASMIHSVDSLRLLDEIEKQGQKVNRVIPCLLQIFIAREETKFGLDQSELEQLLADPLIVNLKYTRIQGLMGMATLTNNQQVVRNEFSALRKLFDNLRQQSLPPAVEMKELSMGMSSDYRIALEEGSTLVRIGTAIFGDRGLDAAG